MACEEMTNKEARSPANDGPGGHGRRKREPRMVGRQRVQELPVRDVPPHALHQHSEWRRHASPLFLDICACRAQGTFADQGPRARPRKWISARAPSRTRSASRRNSSRTARRTRATRSSRGSRRSTSRTSSRSWTSVTGGSGRRSGGWRRRPRRTQRRRIWCVSFLLCGSGPPC